MAYTGKMPIRMPKKSKRGEPTQGTRDAREMERERKKRWSIIQVCIAYRMHTANLTIINRMNIKTTIFTEHIKFNINHVAFDVERQIYVSTWIRIRFVEWNFAQSSRFFQTHTSLCLSHRKSRLSNWFELDLQSNWMVNRTEENEKEFQFIWTNAAKKEKKTKLIIELITKLKMVKSVKRNLLASGICAQFTGFP